MYRARFPMLILSVIILIVGCRQKEESSRQGTATVPRRLTLCHGSVTDLLPRIALEKGFFAEEGLAMTIKEMADGKEAFDNLLKGSCNFAVNGAPPIVLHDPRTATFTILATVMADDDSAKIIARRDRGIGKPEDLKGKRIGIKKGIIGHLFLDLFMMKHRLQPNEVTQVDMETERFPAALASGAIDGFSMTNRMIKDTAKSMGDNAVIFAEPGLNIIYGILSTRTDIPTDLKAVPGVLKALLRAEAYAKSDPAAAQALIGKAYNLTEERLKEIWARTTMEVTLANTIFANLEDQYTWQVERGFFPALPQRPNYLAIVSPDYLRTIKPEAVSIGGR